jgi:hypothetical protein
VTGSGWGGWLSAGVVAFVKLSRFIVPQAGFLCMCGVKPKAWHMLDKFSTTEPQVGEAFKSEKKPSTSGSCL